MIELLQSGKRILNVDESWLSQGSFFNRRWLGTDCPATISYKLISPRLAVLAALDTDGRGFYALTQANTDSDVFMMFMSCLCRKLDSELVDWKDNTVLLLDNARYHVSEECVLFLRRLGVQVMLSGPYSYSKCPRLSLTHLFYSHGTHRAALRQLQARRHLWS